METEQQPSVQENLNESNFTAQNDEQKKKIIRRRAYIGGGVAVVIIAVGVFAYKVYASPERVWNRFIENVKNTKEIAVKQDFNFVYSDKGDSLDQSSNMSMFKNISIGLNGTFYQYSNGKLEDSKAEGEVGYSVSSGSTNMNAKIKMAMLGESIYVKIGDIPLIAGAMSEMNSGKPVDWVNFNLNEFQDILKEETGKSQSDLNEQQKKYSEIFAKHSDKLVTIDKVLGKEKIRGVSTIHYSNNFDKQELKAAVAEILDYAFSQNQLPEDSEEVRQKNKEAEDLAVNFINSYIDKAIIKKFETWLTVDGRLVKVNVQSSAPSLSSFISKGEEVYNLDSSNSSSEQKVQELLSGVDFNGELNFTEEFYDYGKIQEVTAPAESLDFMQKIKEQESMYKQGIDDSDIESTSTPLLNY